MKTNAIIFSVLFTVLFITEYVWNSWNSATMMFAILALVSIIAMLFTIADEQDKRVHYRHRRPADRHW